MSLFEKYLDGSDDAATLELEIGQNDYFLDALEDMTSLDIMSQWRDDENYYPSVHNLFCLIREVWDIAYSHGEHDALIGEGVTLAEIVESEE